MSEVAHDTRPCPLCGGAWVTPVFYPPLVRCGGCGLVFRNLSHIQERVQEEFDDRYQRPEDEQQIQERRRSLYGGFLARHRPAPGRDRLLDVGCGTGQFLLLARAEGWDVVGIEIAKAGVEGARRAGLTVHLGSLTTLALPESSFDLVTFWNVLDFVPDPVEQARAAHRILAPGGVLVARVVNLAPHAALYRASGLLRRWPRLAAFLARHYFFSPISFSAWTLRRTLGRAGFETIEVVNSLPTRGDPYRTLPRGGDPALQAVKRGVFALTWLLAACSGGRVLLGPSLLATAVKGAGGG
jgi:SAM-dependent methyltransferase